MMEEPSHKTVQCLACLLQVEGYNIGKNKDGNLTYHAHWKDGAWKVVES